MSALRWAAVPVIAGALSGSVAVAAANEPPPAPTPTPTPTPTTPLASPDPTVAPEPGASPTPEPTPTPDPPATGTGTVVYLTTVTTTTTTTNVNAPITVVAAPITTTLNNKTAPAARERFVMYLTGCGRPGQSAQDRVRYQRVRLGSNATLVVKVNGKPVAMLQVPANARRGGQRLRLRLARNGRLTIRRPSGRILAVQGCTPA
jgi:hypothetical protein